MKFSLIYADVAWPFATYSDKGKDRSPENHYKVMSVMDIANLPVQSIAADDSVLVFWSTYPHLQNAMMIIEAWGYEYRTCAFTWVKQNKKADSFFMGLGYATRANPEIALLGVRGKGLPRQSKSVRNLLISRIENHSKKPDEARDRLVELYGDVSRVELFARQNADGWTSLGFDIDGRDLRESIPALAENQSLTRI